MSTSKQEVYVQNLSTTVACVIVVYNPNIPTFERVIESVVKQVERIVLVDNHSSNWGNLKKSLALQHDSEKINIIRNNENYGIGRALNQGTSFVLEDDRCKWVLTLDQDSIISDDYVAKILRDLEKVADSEKIGILCGRSFPEPKLTGFQTLWNMGSKIHGKHLENGSFLEVDSIFTSGSLVKAEVARRVRYREEFFMDGVDSDFCYNVRTAGYKILVSCRIFFNHPVGRVVRIGSSSLQFEPGFRLYYIVRNNTVMLIEGKRFFPVYLYIVLTWLLPLIRLGHSDVFRLLARGLIDGASKKLGPRKYGA
jgi:rhamnosyltransferase